MLIKVMGRTKVLGPHSGLRRLWF